MGRRYPPHTVTETQVTVQPTLRVVGAKSDSVNEGTLHRIDIGRGGVGDKYSIRFTRGASGALNIQPIAQVRVRVEVRRGIGLGAVLASSTFSKFFEIRIVDSEIKVLDTNLVSGVVRTEFVVKDSHCENFVGSVASRSEEVTSIYLSATDDI